MRTPQLHDAIIVHRVTIDTTEPATCWVNRVWGERCINAVGFNSAGSPVAFSSLTLLQAEDIVPSGVGPYATFSPGLEAHEPFKS